MNSRAVAFIVVVLFVLVAGNGESDPCLGYPNGFICIAGVTDKYYECNAPYFTGWRACSSGSTCAVVGRHSSNPCTTPGSPGNASPSASEGAENAGSTATSKRSTHWSLWALFGVVLAVIVCGIGVLVFFGVRRHRRTMKE